MTTDPADRADLHQRALTSAQEGISADVAMRHAEGQLAARRELGDREAIALATADYARTISSMEGDPVRALEINEKAWQEFSDLEGTRAGLALMMGIGAQQGTLGRTAEYAAWLDRVIPIAERLDLMEPLTGAFVGLGSSMMEMGRPRQGILLLRGAHELAMKHGFQRRERGARQGLMFWEQWNEPAEGVRLGREGLQIARQVGSQAYVFAMIGNAVVCAIRVGEWDWAVDILREWTPMETEVAQFAELFGDMAVLMALRGEDATTLLDRATMMIGALTDPQFRAYDAWFRAWAAFSVGRFAEARDLAASAPQSIGFFHPLATPLAARAALWAGDPDGARELVNRNTTSYRGEALQVDNTTITASLAALEGRTAEALALYREALAGWRRLGLAWDEALAVIDMVKFLGPTEPEVQTAAESALAALRRLGAKPYIERLEEAMKAPAAAGERAALTRSEAKASVS